MILYIQYPGGKRHSIGPCSATTAMFKALGVLEEMEPPPGVLITVWSDRPPEMRMVGSRSHLLRTVSRWGMNRIGRREVIDG